MTMSTRSREPRNTAPLAAAGGVLWLALGAMEASTTTLIADSLDTTLDRVFILCFAVALIATAAAVMNLRARIARRAGRIAARSTAIGGALVALTVTLDAAVSGTALFEVLATVATITFWLSGIAFAVALARTDSLPSALGWMLAVGMLLFAPLMEVGGSAALGLALLAISGWTVTRPALQPSMAASRSASSRGNA